MCTFLFQQTAVFKALLEILFCNSVLHGGPFLKDFIEPNRNMLRMNLNFNTQLSDQNLLCKTQRPNLKTYILIRNTYLICSIAVIEQSCIK